MIANHYFFYLSQKYTSLAKGQAMPWRWEKWDTIEWNHRNNNNNNNNTEQRHRFAEGGHVFTLFRFSLLFFILEMFIINFSFFFTCLHFIKMYIKNVIHRVQYLSSLPLQIFCCQFVNTHYIKIVYRFHYSIVNRMGFLKMEHKLFTRIIAQYRFIQLWTE